MKAYKALGPDEPAFNLRVTKPEITKSIILICLKRTTLMISLAIDQRLIFPIIAKSLNNKKIISLIRQATN